jgi:hypothetical protein
MEGAEVEVVALSVKEVRRSLPDRTCTGNDLAGTPGRAALEGELIIGGGTNTGSRASGSSSITSQNAFRIVPIFFPLSSEGGGGGSGSAGTADKVYEKQAPGQITEKRKEQKKKKKQKEREKNNTSGEQDVTRSALVASSSAVRGGGGGKSATTSD